MLINFEYSNSVLPLEYRSENVKRKVNCDVSFCWLIREFWDTHDNGV